MKERVPRKRPSALDRLLNKPIEKKVYPPDPIEFTLGLLVGEFIYLRYLPCLSVDSLQTRQVVQVSEEDTLEHDRLHEIWWAKTLENWNDKERIKKVEDEWKEMNGFCHKLQNKYLPHVLDSYVHKINLDEIKDMKQFKDGIRAALWNCDMCSYKIENEDVEIIQDEHHTIIRLKLDLKE